MRVSKYVLALLFGLLAFGCGGGGSGGGAASTGSITVLIGDGPIEDLKEAWLTVRELRLNMAGGNNHVVLDTPQTVELLQLYNLTEMLLMEQIVTGKVNKIRLLLDDLEIVRMDGSVDRLPVPAGGWVELNPQGGFDVRAGETIYVMIDVDMKRSVQVVEGGNGDLNFRPQVFAEIYARGDESRLVRLKGTARGVNDTVDGWDLCDLRREAGDGSSNNNLYDCVHINDDNAVVVENGNVLEENVTVTAFGFMDFTAVEDTMSAEMLVTGTDEPIVSESGRALSIPPADPMVIEQFNNDEPPAAFNFDIHLLSDWKSIPGVTVPATTGDVMLNDDIEAFGFKTGAASMDAFLFVYKRSGSA